MSNDTKAVMQAAERILAAAIQLVGGMRAPTIAPDRLQVALYLTIVEQFQAALVLAGKGMHSHSATHVRAMVEAQLSMNLLGKDPNYAQQMMYDKLRSEKKLYEGLLLDPELPPEGATRIGERLEAYNQLHDKKFRPGRISERFGEAELAHLAAPYTVLCGFSHNDLAILSMRHQGKKGMQYMMPTAPSVVVSIFWIANMVIVPATRPLKQLAYFPADDFDVHFDEMNAAWGLSLNSQHEPM